MIGNLYTASLYLGFRSSLEFEYQKGVDVISTGSISLDSCLGVGGVPKGRIIEIYGPEASGKTTLALHAIAETQRSGGITAFVDAEHAFDPTYAKGLGIKNEDLLISQPDYGEQALEIVDQLIRSSAVDMIVIDSVSALTPKAELDGEMGDTHVGLQARLMSQALRKITATVSKSKTTVIFINQLRMKIGVPSYMSPETTSGGNALKFYCSVRLDVRRIAEAFSLVTFGSSFMHGSGETILGQLQDTTSNNLFAYILHQVEGGKLNFKIEVLFTFLGIFVEYSI